jgi:AcrR family transcriptional regulator
MTSVEHRSRRRTQRQNTRQEILAAANQFLRRRPYRELSVQAVMTRPGLTRTAFYRHFDDVTDLVLTLLAEVGGELYGVAERWLQDAQRGFEPDADLGFHQAAREGLRGIVDFFVRNGPLVRAIAEAAATDERIERAYDGFLDSFTELTAFGLRHMVENGRIEPLDPWPVARALNLMNERYLLAEFGREPGGDADIAFATLQTVWLRTMAPGQGQPQTGVTDTVVP